MNYTEQDLERALRSAPAPVAPQNLEQKLIEHMQTTIAITPHSAGSERPKGWTTNKSWFRRWWLALGPAAVSLACAAVLTSQHLEIRNLRQQLQASITADALKAVSRPVPPGASTPGSRSEASPADDQAEIQRLRELRVTLSQEITRLHLMQDENDKLRRQLAAASFANLTQDEKDALQKGKDKAEMIKCVNNLKQIGLAMRMWSLDNDDAYPPNFLVMSNELSTPKILVCPSDTAHPAASDFASFGPANCSYEYFAPDASEKPAFEPDRVMVRCLIHGSIGLSDGSVQSEVGRKHPEQLIERDGKLYFKVTPPPGSAPNHEP